MRFDDDDDRDLDSTAEGYECGRCGYVPTERELKHGSCPGCRVLEVREKVEGEEK